MNKNIVIVDESEEIKFSRGLYLTVDFVGLIEAPLINLLHCLHENHLPSLSKSIKKWFFFSNYLNWFFRHAIKFNLTRRKSEGIT